MFVSSLFFIFLHFLIFFCVFSVVFVKFLKERMQDTRAKEVGNSQLRRRVRKFRTSANFHTELQLNFVSTITFSSKLRFE